MIFTPISSAKTRKNERREQYEKTKAYVATATRKEKI